MEENLSFEDLFEELTGKKLEGADTWFAKKLNESIAEKKEAERATEKGVS